MNNPPNLSISTLMTRYEGVLLDSFGVLLDSSGAINGAAEMIEHFHKHDYPYLVLTNDASRSAARKASWYKKVGIPISEDRIMTSGSMLKYWFQTQQWQDKPCVVLGPEDSKDYARQAGALLVDPGDDSAEVIIACDDAGYPFLESIEAVMSQIFRAIEDQRHIDLLLPNPDLIYPKGNRQFGFTSGSIALLLEEAITLRYPDLNMKFTRLGKPCTPIFEAAAAQMGTRKLLMVGDQLRTDIKGALDFGIDAALVDTGLTQWGTHTSGALRPTWLLPSLHPSS